MCSADGPVPQTEITQQGDIFARWKGNHAPGRSSQLELTKESHADHVGIYPNAAVDIAILALPFATRPIFLLHWRSFGAMSLLALAFLIEQ